MPLFIEKPTVIEAAGNKPKLIEEFFGRVNSDESQISIARMKSPAGWIEPAQTPGFDEYTVVLNGRLNVEINNKIIEVNPGQAIKTLAGERVKYYTPEGAEYIAICLPAFSPDTVNREES